jgi:hypothetical protein
LAAKSKVPYPFTVKLCSDRAAFEARLQRKLILDMNEVERRLKLSKRHEITLFTPHVIFLRTGSAEITLSRDGRMLIKRVQNEAEAARLAREVLQVILE